ncbi:hypothetical protein SK128_011812 [Halocaridina rubra]|uniref:Major facilitator superfamily (MFS) profile domain-containing protein n=1 Tax=Halocaridina rubra TaxID=373956 RepID=A0AAN8WS40_HALRR
MEDNFDAILTKLGTGKWNIFYYILMMYWYACVCYHTLGGAFFAPPVGHTCQSADLALKPTVILPTNAHKASLPGDNFTTYTSGQGIEGEIQDSCTYMMQDNETDKIKEIECLDWDFDNATFSSTVTSEFGLVCKWEYLRATYQSIYMFGIFVGAGINGYMADKYGRKKMIMISSFFYSIIAIGSAWLPTISTVLVARFFLGTMHPTSLQTGFILAMEVTEPKRRTAVGIVQFLSWGIATILWGAWAYLIRDWRWLQLAVSLPSLLFVISLWIIDESPRWLIVAGRHEEAIRVLERAAYLNKAELPPRDKLLTLMKDIHNRVTNINNTAISTANMHH